MAIKLDIKNLKLSNKTKSIVDFAYLLFNLKLVYSMGGL